eukprot:TRINITY_DN4003_c0_g1_i6.p1 TRINITY_DN4003_c0_g1~~TRINITY_DN4003_c0_g1_i6.p1  ORF type:complete len:723 (+),score=108.66 TRINITY_DN4003_c0_g1_i6:3-2171(+)
MSFRYKQKPSIKRPWHCDGWKEYQDYFREKFGEDFDLIMPCIFLDEYEQMRQRKKKFTGIYATFANMKEPKIFVLAVLPHVEKDDYHKVLHQVLKEIIIPQARELEAGVTFPTATKNGAVQRRYCGSIYAIFGDDIGHRAAGGFASPLSALSSRYTFCPRDLLPCIIYPFRHNGVEILQPRWRNADEMKDLIAQISHLTPAQALAKLDSVGHESVTPLWELEAFSMNLYKRFGICHLHVAWEGNWLRHLLYLAIKYGEVFWKKVNQNLRELEGYHGIRRFLNGIYVAKKNSRQGHPVAVTYLAGAEIQSLLQVIYVCLLGTGISDEDLLGVKLHLDSDRLIWEAKEFQKDDLSAKSLGIIQWQISFLRSFSNTFGISLTYSKFECERLYPELIKFLCPPQFMCSLKFEHQNFTCKFLGNRSNHKDADIHILKKTQQLCFWNQEDDMNPQSEVHVAPDFQIFSRKTFQITLNRSDLTAIAHQYLQNGVEIRKSDISPIAKAFRGFHLSGHRILPLGNPEPGKTTTRFMQIKGPLARGDDERTMLYFELLQISQISVSTGMEGRKDFWLKGNSFLVLPGQSPMIHLKSDGILWIPFQWSPNYQIRKVVQIVNPKSLSSAIFVYNGHIRSEILAGTEQPFETDDLNEPGEVEDEESEEEDEEVREEMDEELDESDDESDVEQDKDDMEFDPEEFQSESEDDLFDDEYAADDGRSDAARSFLASIA